MKEIFKNSQISYYNLHLNQLFKLWKKIKILLGVSIKRNIEIFYKKYQFKKSKIDMKI